MVTSEVTEVGTKTFRHGEGPLFALAVDRRPASQSGIGVWPGVTESVAAPATGKQPLGASEFRESGWCCRMGGRVSSAQPRCLDGRGRPCFRSARAVRAAQSSRQRGARPPPVAVTAAHPEVLPAES